MIKFVFLNFFENSILNVYATSAQPSVFRTVCQNLAITSGIYPFPDDTFKWINGVKIGTVTISPPVFQNAFWVVCKSYPTASIHVSQNPILLTNW